MSNTPLKKAETIFSHNFTEYGRCLMDHLSQIAWLRIDQQDVIRPDMKEDGVRDGKNAVQPGSYIVIIGFLNENVSFPWFDRVKLFSY